MWIFTKKKTCFYLQYVIQHVKKKYSTLLKIQTTECAWCVFFYFVKCKTNAVSAKSFQSSCQCKTKLYALCCVYIHIISPSNFFAASLSTYGDDIWNIGIGTVQPPNRRHWQIIHYMYINGSFVWIWEISPKKILLAFSQITKKKEAIALFRSLGIRFQKTFFFRFAFY